MNKIMNLFKNRFNLAQNKIVFLCILGSSTILYINQDVWFVSAWLCAISFLTILYFGTLNQSLSKLDVGLLVLFSGLVVYYFSEFFDIEINLSVFRIFFTLGGLLLGLVIFFRQDIPHFQKNMVYAATVVLGIQLATGLYLLSVYSNIEEKIKEDHQSVSTYQDSKEIFKTCAKNKWWCLKGTIEDKEAPEIYSSQEKVLLYVEGMKFIENNLATEYDDPKSWSWKDSWVSLPEIKFPLVITYYKQQDGQKLIIIDNFSMWETLDKLRKIFSKYTTLFGLLILAFGLLKSGKEYNEWINKNV